MPKKIGLYVHFPFCAAKCPYCDFYSLRADEGTRLRYAQKAAQTIRKYATDGELTFDTVYYGGGTPSFAGMAALGIVSSTAREFTARGSDIEFTVECNPSYLEDGIFDSLYASGVNRISLGLQSAVDAERRALGRRSGRDDVLSAVKRASAAGINNISLDLMLGIPGQTADSLAESVAFCAKAGATHVSAYILKLEEGTPFFERRESLGLPGEEQCTELYLRACELLGQYGYRQYEISNFSLSGYESRHNLKYWNAEEYLGIGPSAHSFIDGKRFFYGRDLEAFMDGEIPIQDGFGGDFDEYAMLRLRLNEGLTEEGVHERFGIEIPSRMRRRAGQFADNKRLISDDKGIRMTAEGFLISNYIISRLL